jgi:hypothetical protein
MLARAETWNKKKFKPTLILPSCFENIRTVPGVNANVLLHGYPGGVRHEPVDIKAALERYGFHITPHRFGYTVTKQNGQGLDTYFGTSLVDVLHLLKDEDGNCETLYHHVVRDPLEQTKSIISGGDYALSTDEYLFGEVTDEHRADQLHISRVYRSLLGKSVNYVSRWSQYRRFGDGYGAWQFPVQAGDANVYHIGAGGWFAQYGRSINTTGIIRQVDPLRNGMKIEVMPPEPVCVSGCSGFIIEGENQGRATFAEFYPYYEGWIRAGKTVYFKGDLLNPPGFACEMLGGNLTLPHNNEFIGKAHISMTTKPDYEAARASMSEANATRNLCATTGEIKWPEYDKERVEQLLCGRVGYRHVVPKVVNTERKICGKARFPITKRAFAWRCNSSRAASPHKGISMSTIVWLYERLVEPEDETDLTIDLLRYPYFENHQFVEECLWSFEECASKLGFVRNKQFISGAVTRATMKNFESLVIKSSARH